MISSWNPWAIKIYFHLVCSANTQETEWRDITIKRGQLVRSLRSIQSEVSYIIHYAPSGMTNRQKTPSVSTVQRVLDHLKAKQLIDIKTIQFGMLITIKNYEYLATTPITKVIQQDLTKTIQQKIEIFEGPKWIADRLKNGGFKK